MKYYVYIALMGAIIASSLYIENNYENVNLLFFRVIAILLLAYSTFKLLIDYIQRDKPETTQKNTYQNNINKDNHDNNIISCKNCGTKHYNNSNYCHICGTKLEK